MVMKQHMYNIERSGDMQVATGKSILNGIAIGKVKIYKAPSYEINENDIGDTDAELNKFEAALEKAIDGQNALYDKALEAAGEESAEIFEVHAMMLEDDDLQDAVKEIITGQKKSAEYAVGA